MTNSWNPEVLISRIGFTNVVNDIVLVAEAIARGSKIKLALLFRQGEYSSHLEAMPDWQETQSKESRDSSGSSV
jgi:hypothetical protein